MYVADKDYYAQVNINMLICCSVIYLYIIVSYNETKKVAPANSKQHKV